MIERRDLQSGIARSWAIVGTLELAETISSPAPLPVNEEFRDLILSPNSDYVSVYTAGLRLSHYNFLLNDFSFFQFGWTSPDHVRYAYFPNPFAKGEETEEFLNMATWRDDVSADLMTHEDYLALLRDIRPTIGVPVIRYENDPTQYRPFHHPCSHLHFGHHSDNRWPLNRVLTPLAFTSLILKNYYGDTWRKIGLAPAGDVDNSLEAGLITERMNCRLIGDNHFSQHEARSFYLA